MTYPYQLQVFLDALARQQKRLYPTAHPAWKGLVAAGYIELWNRGYRPDAVGDWYMPTERGPLYTGRITMTLTYGEPEADAT